MPFAGRKDLEFERLKHSDLKPMQTLLKSMFGEEEGKNAAINLNAALAPRGRTIGKRLEYWVLRSNGEPVGLTGLYSMPQESVHSRQQPNKILRLGWTFISPRAPGLGLGRMMIEAMEKRAKKLGANFLAVETSDEEASGVRTYERMGYRRGFSGVREYFGPGSHLITAYSPTSEKTAPLGGYSIRRLSLKDMEDNPEEFRKIAGKHQSHVSQLVRISDRNKAGKMGGVEVHGLFDRFGKLRAIIDSGRYGHVSPETAFTRFLLGKTPMDRKVLLRAFSSHLYRSGAFLHVLNVPTGQQLHALKRDHGYREATDIPGIYGRDYANITGMFFTKKLK